MKLDPIRNKPNLYKDPRSGIIYFRKYKAGFGEITKSTGTSIQKEADKIADEIRAKFFNEEVKNPENIRMLIEDEWKAFLEIQKTKAKATYSSMEIQGRLHLMPFFGGYFSHEINEVVWEKYVAYSREMTPKRKLFNDRKYLSMLVNHLHRQGKVKRVPIFRDTDPEIKKGKVYLDHEIERLLGCSKGDLTLQILMGVTMGMRVGEIMSLEWDQIDLGDKTIFLPDYKTKIRKSRKFGISDQAFNLLYLRETKTGPLFPSPTDPAKTLGRTGNKRSWATCKRNAKVTGRFHDLRHTFLTKAFKISVNPALICEYAGLSLEEAQKTYLHFTPEDTRVVSTLVTYSAARPKSSGANSESQDKIDTPPK